MDIVYGMPGQCHRMFVNVIHACPNACLFCVDFKGDRFFGFDLKGTRAPSADEILSAVEKYPLRQSLKEVYICGIGEPLLRYQIVLETARRIRSLLPKDIVLGINTSGTFYLYTPQVDFAREFDLIHVSLNAENKEKYDLICRPKVRGAYKALMAFLDHLKRFLEESRLSSRVELSIVDTSNRQDLPLNAQRLTSIPTPDIEACRRIAAGFGWPLKVKTLIKDCESVEWNYFPLLVKPLEQLSNASIDL